MWKYNEFYFPTYISFYQIFQNALFHYNNRDQKISDFFGNKENAIWKAKRSCLILHWERKDLKNTRKSSTNKQSRDPLSLVKRKRALTGESHDKTLITVHRARAREGWRKLRNLVRVSLTFAWKTRNWLAHSNSGSGRDRVSFYGCVKPSAGLRARWIKPPFSFLSSRRTAASPSFPRSLFRCISFSALANEK